jgi:hypothetical protein
LRIAAEGRGAGAAAAAPAPRTLARTGTIDATAVTGAVPATSRANGAAEGTTGRDWAN